MIKVFIISDTHFGHNNIIKYAGRPFDNTQEMDECLVQWWNETVSPQDKVYHLGDVTLGKKNLEIINKLNGKITLIGGNHDIYNTKEYMKYFDNVRACKEINGYILTHIPVHPDQRYRYKGNIHGHMHEKLMDDPWYFSTCVEQINYRPINIEEIYATYKRNGFNND